MRFQGIRSTSRSIDFPSGLSDVALVVLNEKCWIADTRDFLKCRPRNGVLNHSPLATSAQLTQDLNESPQVVLDNPLSILLLSQ